MLKVVKVNFPFVDSPEESKGRPAILLSSQPYGEFNLVLVCFMTTKIVDISPLDIVIERNSEGFLLTGLVYTTVVKPYKIATLSVSQIEYEIGIISESYTKTIKNSLRKIFEI
jgi:mRNA-degrading endonuclease toxin of MazEF toxin-antitoxin module